MEQTIWWDTQTGKRTVSLKKNAVIPEGMTDKEPLPNSEWDGNDWVINSTGIETLKNEKLAEIRNNANDILEPYVALYCQPERDSWVDQLSEAQGYNTDNTFPTPFLDSIVDEGVNKDELVAAILENNTNFKMILAKVLGQRVVKSDNIKAIYNNVELTNQEKIDQMNLVNVTISI